MRSGATAVYLAAQNGHLETLRYLVEEGGASVRILAYDRMSCLHAAAQMGHLECVRWLVTNHGLKVNDKDFDGSTPLHLAASNGHVEVIAWLLNNGALILSDSLGGTPLHDAAEHGQLQSVRILMQKGCDINVRDEDGMTAAELAEICWKAECAAAIRLKNDKIILVNGMYDDINSSGKEKGHYQHTTRQTVKDKPGPPSLSSRSSQTDSTLPPEIAKHEDSFNSNNKSEGCCTMSTKSIPPAPPLPPPLRSDGTERQSGWTNMRGKAADITKSFLANTICSSTPSRKEGTTHITKSTSMDLIAELKATNGVASLKRTKKNPFGSSQYFGTSRTMFESGQEGNSVSKQFESLGKTSKLINNVQNIKDSSATDLSTKVKLTEEFDPAKFLDQVPDNDKAGMSLPSWKRLLIARQIAEKAQKEHSEKEKVEQEEVKYKNMPLWKRALLQKRNSAKSLSSHSITPSAETGLKSEM